MYNLHIPRETIYKIINHLRENFPHPLSVRQHLLRFRYCSAVRAETKKKKKKTTTTKILGQAKLEQKIHWVLNLKNIVKSDPALSIFLTYNRQKNTEGMISCSTHQNMPYKLTSSEKHSIYMKCELGVPSSSKLLQDT